MQKTNNKIIKNLKTVRGFTLIELLAVVAIIGFFTSVIFTNLSGSKARARDAIRIDAVKSLGQATELFLAENHDFPSSLDDLKQYFTDNILPINPQTTDGTGFFYEKIIKGPGNPTNGYCIGVVLETAPATTAECGTFVANYKIKGP